MQFNLLPGSGLGFTGSKLIAFGLGAVTVKEVPIVQPDLYLGGGGGGYSTTVYDNAYSRTDDDEIVELLTIIFQVIK